MKNRITVVTVVLASALTGLVLSAVPAAAQSASPCREEAKKICSDITAGGGRMLQCYEQRKEKFSANCRSWVEAAKSQAGKVKAACEKEINSSCNREKGDPIEMLDCLQGNYSDLSRTCAEQINFFKSLYPLPVQ